METPVVDTVKSDLELWASIMVSLKVGEESKHSTPRWDNQVVCLNPAVGVGSGLDCYWHQDGCNPPQQHHKSAAWLIHRSSMVIGGHWYQRNGKEWMSLRVRWAQKKSNWSSTVTRSSRKWWAVRQNLGWPSIRCFDWLNEIKNRFQVNMMKSFTRHNMEGCC